MEVLPFALQDPRMALKGGTAINLFYRDLPRLSIDIDLTYLPLEDRKTTFQNVHSILEKIQTNLVENLGLKVVATHPLDGQRETKLLVSQEKIEIKIEPNFIIRGSLFEPTPRPTSVQVQAKFSKDIEVKCLSMADLYGGKIVAALDRQHPRDFFDLFHLFKNEGITKEIKDAFIFYLLSHNRPPHEILNPNILDLDGMIENEFRGMTEDTVTSEKIKGVQKRLSSHVRNSMNPQDKAFLLSFFDGQPQWERFSFPKIQTYPSIQWKILNLSKMDYEKRKNQREALEKILD